MQVHHYYLENTDFHNNLFRTCDYIYIYNIEGEDLKPSPQTESNNKGLRHSKAGYGKLDHVLHFQHRCMNFI